MENIFHCGFCFSKLASKKCYKMKHISFLKKLLTLYVEETPHPASLGLKVKIEIKIKKENSKNTVPQKNFNLFLDIFFIDVVF